MRVDVPEIVYHDDLKPILSLDLHPSGRLATAGADHNVRIWRVTQTEQQQQPPTSAPAAAAHAQQQQPTASTPTTSHKKTSLTFLANLEFHQQPVNVVRFSPDGKYLASASDDHWVVIWHRIDKKGETEGTQASKAAADSATAAASAEATATALPPATTIDLTGANSDGSAASASATASTAVAPAPSSSPSSSSSSLPFGVDPDEVLEQQEEWVPLQRMRGHLSEIYDLCWSPTSMELLSGSIDHHTLVWSLAAGSFVQSIKDHTGYVQGVAWDPLNQYMATQSSDRTVRIYERKRSGKSGKASSKSGGAEFVEKHVLRHRKVPRAHLTPGSNTKGDTTPVEVSGSAIEDVKDASSSTAPADVSDPTASPHKEKPSSTHITRPLFMDDTYPSYFRRLSFSPDGSFLVAPAGCFHAEEPEMNANGEVANLSGGMSLLNKLKVEALAAEEKEKSTPAAERDALSSSTSARGALPTCYVFHRSDFTKPVCHLPQMDPVVAVKFCPRLFERRHKTNNAADTQKEGETEANATPAPTSAETNADVNPESTPQAADSSSSPSPSPSSSFSSPPSSSSSLSTLSYRMLFCVATLKSLLIYSTDSLYPLVLIKNIHHHNLTDVAWNQEGSMIAVSSSDGYCSFVQVEEEGRELGKPLAEEEMKRYQEWWGVRRAQIHSALFDPPPKSGDDKRRKSGAVDDESQKAKTAIVTLLGAEPAPLPTWTPPTDGVTIISKSDNGATTTTTHLVRPHSELLRHALELLESGQKLTCNRMLNDCGTGPKRAKRILAEIDTLALRSIRTAFNPALLPTTTDTESDAKLADFEVGLCQAFGVEADKQDLKSVLLTKRKKEKFVFSIQKKEPTQPQTVPPAAGNEATATPAAVTPIVAPATATVTAPVAAASEETATEIAAIPSDAAPSTPAKPAQTQPQEPSTPAPVAPSTPSVSAPAAAPVSSPAAPLSPKSTPARLSSPHATPAPKSLASPASTTPASASASSGHKRKGPGSGAISSNSKPKTTIMDLFKKAAANNSNSKVTSTAAAKHPAVAAVASPSVSSATAAPATASKSGDVVDLTSEESKAAVKPPPKAKRRITPIQPDENNKGVATSSTQVQPSAPMTAPAPTPAPTPSAPVSSAPAAVSVSASDSSEDEEDDDPSADVYEVERIVKKRVVRGQTQYFIKWKGYDSAQNTWEDEGNLDCQEEIDKFERNQKKRRIMPTLLGDNHTHTTAPAPAPAPTAASAPAIAVAPAAPSLPSRSSSATLPRATPGAATSIASLDSPSRKRPADSLVDEQKEGTSSQLAASLVASSQPAASSSPPAVAAATAASADDVVHHPPVKKAKRRITPQVIQQE